MTRRLSTREAEVVTGLRQFKPYKAIAHDLGIAESTARVLGSRALRKMRLTRTALRIRKHPRTQRSVAETGKP